MIIIRYVGDLKQEPTSSHVTDTGMHIQLESRQWLVAAAGQCAVKLQHQFKLEAAM